MLSLNFQLFDSKGSVKYENLGYALFSLALLGDQKVTEKNACKVVDYFPSLAFLLVISCFCLFLDGRE